MTLDDSIAQINTLAAQLTPGEQEMNKAGFDAYVEAQIAAATAEATGGKADLAKQRLSALKAQIEAHKASYESDGSSMAKVKMYVDPWITLPTTKVANVTDVPKVDSGIQNPGDLPMTLVETSKGALQASALLKALVMLAKASDKSPLRTKLAKSDQGKVLVAKAGEATAILSKIATMFGIEVVDSEDLLDCELRWDVGDMISALQSAARLENVMSTLGGTMTMKATPATTPAAPAAPAVPPAAPAVETPAATTTQKSSSETLDFGVERELVDPLNDGNWPLDLNERAPLAKDAFSVKPKTA